MPAGVRRVLELGCGAGVFGAELKRRHGAEVVGVEVFPEAAAQARERLDRVLVADVERGTLDLPESSFDLLVCNDVLEHLVEPWQTLQRVARLVRPGGWVLASIPNVRFHKVLRRLIWPGVWRYEDSGVLDRTHLRFFTRESACELVRDAGFAIERVEGLSRSKFPVWLRLVNLLTGKRLSDMEFLQFAILARRSS